MATSGSFTGARGGTSTGPYLTLDWSRTQTDVTNNRSLIHLTLKLHSDYSINFSGNKTGLLQGTSYTYSGGMTSPGVVTLKELDVWVNHNSDGTLTTTFSGTFDLNISWSGVNTGTISVSGSATIDTIPRSSVPTLSATTFDMGTTITINTNRASTSFTHTLTYIFGNDTTNIAFDITDSFAWTVPLTLANQIPSATAGIGSIVCSTYNGGTLIGQQSVGFTANVPSSIVPTASGLSVAIDGTGQDKTLNKYVQNVTKVLSSFSSAGVYSSTISSNSITVKRQSDNGDLQTISGTSGTTANPVALSGTYLVTASATDSRGRTVTLTATFTVDAYSKPTITTFTTARDGTTTTKVNATLNLSWSPLGTSNTANISVVGVDNVGTSATLYTLNGSTAGLLNTTQAYTSQSDASSYTYTLTVTDTFGNTATAIATVSTSFAEFTIAKGKGVGVGKVWQQGALDVGGDAYVSGKLYIPDSFNGDGSGTLIVPMTRQDDGGAIHLADNTDFNTLTKTGLYRINSTTNSPVKSSLNPDKWWYVQIIRHASNWLIQVAFDYRDGVYIRRLYDNGGTTAWDSWRRINDDRKSLSYLNAGGQSLAPNTAYRVDWGAPSINENSLFSDADNMFRVTEPGWYKIDAWTYFAQSIGTGFYLEWWGSAQYGHQSIVSTWAPANGYNYYAGSLITHCIPGETYEVTIKHSDSGYTRSIADMRCCIHRI